MSWKSRFTKGLQSIGLVETRSFSKPGTAPIDLHAARMAFSEVVSQPVWGPEISTVGAYSREGYTTRTFLQPYIPLSKQVTAFQEDEDVQLAINHLSSVVTGGEHYWQGASETVTDYMEDFCDDLDFDWFDTILVKELLAYGNSVWKPRLGIQYIRSADDLMHIPISSFVRIWIDRQRIPYKYEFRGSEYQGYHNKEDIIHFKWNPINANIFGTGFLTALLTPRYFEDIGPSGTTEKRLPPMLDRKYSTTMSMHLAEKRYISRNVYQAIDADDDERAQLQSDLRNLETNEDFVVGSKLEVQELGSQQRDFDPAKFTDLTQGAIFKALNDFRGKQGSEESHQYANAEVSSILDEIGLASFPFAVSRQLIDKLFKPWYIGNPMYDPMYGGGLVGMAWDDHKLKLNFGHVEKKNIELADAIKLLELGIQSGAVADPLEIRDILESNGLQVKKEYSDQLMQQQNTLAMDPMSNPEYGMQTDFGGGPVYPQFDNQTAGIPPMTNAIYDDMSRNPRPTDIRLNL